MQTFNIQWIYHYKILYNFDIKISYIIGNMIINHASSVTEIEQWSNIKGTIGMCVGSSSGIRQVAARQLATRETKK